MTGAKPIKVTTMQIKLVNKEVLKNKKEITNAATANAIPTP